MIHVVILTKNRSYSILDVPANGRLLIREDHLLCGVTQNGVKMIPYGTVLTPWEVFIWDNTLSLEMLPNSAFSMSGRVLDFTIIELLQAQETLHPSQSGSTTEFSAPTFEEGGYPINYNFIVAGLNLSSTAEAQELLRRQGTWYKVGSAGDTDAKVNAIADLGNGYQELSTIDFETWGSYIWSAVPFTAVIDRKGLIKDHTGYPFHTPKELQFLEMAGWTDLRRHTYNGFTGLKKATFAGLKTMGADPAVNNGAFTGYPNFVNIEIPRIFETMNAGAPHASVQYAIDTLNAVITYLD